MPNPVYAPRVNNNDDFVKVAQIEVKPGDQVSSGDIIAVVETDKAAVDVEAEVDGFVLKILCEEDQKIAVGSVLLWLGSTADETVPQEDATQEARKSGMPTAKARALLKQHGLQAEQIPVSGDRLKVKDIETYLETQNTAVTRNETTQRELIPEVPGKIEPLGSEEQGMLNTVRWHRDFAVPGYLEVRYDPQRWDDYAASYAEQHKLLLSPLLSLLAFRFLELVKETAKLNTTIVNEEKYCYQNINLGFTVQAGETLYLTVLREAERYDRAGFLEAFGDIQRRAMGKKLKAEELQGATIAFSSMARWPVSRHIPILPPHCSLMIAHAATSEYADGSQAAVIGASYDHRALSGVDVALLLKRLVEPPKV